MKLYCNPLDPNSTLNMDNGGRKHYGKYTPKVHPSKREELQQLLHSKFHNIVQIHVIEGGHKDVEIEAEIAEVAYDWHISEMKKILESLKLPYPNPYGKYLQVKRHNEMIDETINSLREELK